VALTAAGGRPRSLPLHPFHAVLLAGALPLFLGALLSDWAYGASYEVQWANFASWLLAGALVFSGFALLWSLIDLVRADRRGRRSLLAFLLLLATWALGFVDALVHAKDGWAMMPEGLILSAVTSILAIAAVWTAFAVRRSGVTS
jgi:uncharacterized membrane protein